MSEEQLTAIGTKIGELMKAVVILNARVIRLAKWNAEHVLRIVELRAQLKAQWESTRRHAAKIGELKAEVMELRNALGTALGGMPAKVGYMEDGKYVTKWAAVTAQGEPVQNIPALFPGGWFPDGQVGRVIGTVGPVQTVPCTCGDVDHPCDAHRDANEPAIPPSGFWGAQTPIPQCAVCGSLDLQCRMSSGPREECHPGGWNLGQETPGVEDVAGVYEFNTKKAQLSVEVLPDDSGVVHTTGESEGVNPAPQPSTGLGAGEDD